MQASIDPPPDLKQRPVDDDEEAAAAPYSSLQVSRNGSALAGASANFQAASLAPLTFKLLR